MQKALVIFLVGVGITGVVVAALYFVPWKVTWQQNRTVTVTGMAQTQKTNEVARFSAGVNAVNDDKQKAVNDVNTKIQALIDAMKQFGIEAKDIKTQNLSISQMQEMDPGSQKQRLGQWMVNNTVEITLRDVKRANELTDVLSQSGANNVYGPNFSLDSGTNADTELMSQAIADARTKAEAMAQATGAKLGKVVVVTEGAVAGIQPPMMYDRAMGMGGGANAATEVGSTTVSKSVTVTFELR